MNFSIYPSLDKLDKLISFISTPSLCV